MCVALALISYFMYLSLSYTPTAVVILVIIYNAFFGYSWGPIPWLYPPEILPLSVRAKGASLSTASNWLFNFIVGEATPILQEYITWRLYLIHSFSCLCSFICVYFLYPETMGVNLEDMGSLFGDKSTISSSLPSSASSLVGAQIDSRSVLSQDTHPYSPVLQPSAASLARGGPPRSRSNSGGYQTLNTGSAHSHPGGPAASGSYAAALSGHSDFSSPLARPQEDDDDEDIEDYEDEPSKPKPTSKHQTDSSTLSVNPAPGESTTISGFLGRMFKKNENGQDLESGGSSRPLLQNRDDE